MQKRNSDPTNQVAEKSRLFTFLGKTELEMILTKAPQLEPRINLNCSFYELLPLMKNYLE